MSELLVKDIYSEFSDEIESDFIRIKQISNNQPIRESQLFVGTLQRVARKIYMRYGQRIVPYEDLCYAEIIIYNQLLRCTCDLQKKYFGSCTY